jgi:drug/metabolite transporter (DMT)-like permease
MKIDSVKIVFAYLLACLIWGTTWLAIRVGLEDLTPLVSGGYRFILASLLIFVLMKIRKIPLETDKISIRLYLMMAFFSFSIPFSFVYWGEQYVPSGLASVLFAVYPFFIIIYSIFLLPGEKIDAYKLSGILLGFSGIVIIFSDQIGGDFSAYLLGMILIVISAIMQAGAGVIIKKYGYYLNPLAINLIPMFIAGVMMLATGFVFEDTSNIRYSSNAILSIIYLAFFGSVVTFTSYYWLLKRVSIVILSLIAFITPVIALLAGWIFYSEELGIRQISGSVIVLLSLFGANMGNIIKYYKSDNDLIQGK